MNTLPFEKNKIYRKRNFVILVLFNVLALFPIFPPALQSISLGVFCGLSVLFYYEKFILKIKEKKILLSFLYITSYYLLLIGSYFWTKNKIGFYNEIQPNIVMIVLPIVICFFSNTEKLKKNLDNFYNIFLISMTIFFVIWMQYMVIGLRDYQHYYPYGSYPWLYMVPHIENSYLFSSSINLKNYYHLFKLVYQFKGALELSVAQGYLHSKRECLFLTHYAYVGMMVNFCIAILVNKLINHKKFLGKAFLILWILFFVFFQLILNSKTNKGVLLLMVIIYFLYKLYLYKKYLSYSLFCLFLCFIGREISLNYLSYFEFSFENNSFNRLIDFERYNIYKASFEIIKPNFLFGVGLGDVSNVLNSKLSVLASTLHNDVNYNLTYNSHNQYIHILISTGIIGLFLFVFSYFWHLKMIIVSKSKLLFFFILILGINLLFENIFSRFNGAMFAILFIMINFVEYYEFAE
jgi:O-antigen ligase